LAAVKTCEAEVGRLGGRGLGQREDDVSKGEMELRSTPDTPRLLGVDVMYNLLAGTQTI
jgi:hypothetical protein